MYEVLAKFSCEFRQMPSEICNQLLREDPAAQVQPFSMLLKTIKIKTKLLDLELDVIRQMRRNADG